MGCGGCDDGGKGIRSSDDGESESEGRKYEGVLSSMYTKREKKRAIVSWDM